MSCPKCEEARLAGKKFCTQCGARLIEDVPAAAPVPEQPSAQPEPERSQWSGVYHEPAAAQEPERSQWTGVAAPPPEPVHTYTPPETTGTYTAPSPEPPKKKKKNIPAIAAISALVALIAAAAVLYFTGVISFGGDKDDADAKEKDEPTASVEPSEEPEPEPSEEPEPEPEGTYTISDAVLEDNDICRVTLNEVTEDDDTIYFEVTLENTSDEFYTISADLDAIDEYELRDYDFYARADLDGGESVTETIEIEKEITDFFNIGDIDKASFIIEAAKDWENDIYPLPVDVDRDVYPTGKSASSFSRPRRVALPNEAVVYSDNDLRFMICDPGVDSDNDYSFDVYAENESRKRLAVMLEDFTINGVSYDNSSFVYIGGGHAMYELLWFSQDALAEIGLSPEDVETVTFTLKLYDWDTFEEIDTTTCTFGG